MKAVPLTILLWAFMVLVSYGQNPGAMAIRSRLEQGAAPSPNPPANAQAATPGDEWQQAKKLTFLKTVPSSPRAPEECLSPENLSKGLVGYMECWPTVVARVVGPTDVLLAVASQNVPPIRLTGYPTKGLIVGEMVRLVGPVEVVSAKSPTASPASKTVCVVRLVRPEKFAELQLDPNTSPAQPRKWTDAAGKYSVMATYLGVEDDQVALRREPDGKTLHVPLARLCEADQKWVRDELARQADPKPNAPQKAAPTKPAK